MKSAKVAKVPPPGAYNLPKDKLRGLPKSTSEQRMLVSEAQYRGKSGPGYKYTVDKGVTLTKPTIHKVKIYADKKTAKPSKPKEPNMCSYNSLNSFKKTQLFSYESKFLINKGKK